MITVLDAAILIALIVYCAAAGLRARVAASRILEEYFLAGRVALTEVPLLVPDIDRSDLRLLRAGGRYSTPSFTITPITVTYPIRLQRRGHLAGGPLRRVRDPRGLRGIRRAHRRARRRADPRRWPGH